MTLIQPPVVTQQAHCLHLGKRVPSFEVDSTKGRINLEDYQGHWLVLFSYSADFTPVSSTEVVAFGKLHQQFKDIGCQVLGLSTDSVASHIPWLESIENWLGEGIEYPIIGDYDGRISKLYGVYQPSIHHAESVRCTFIIDDNLILRTLLVYPAVVGRNTDEILRIVRALQVSNKLGKATPANWQVGEELLRVLDSN